MRLNERQAQAIVSLRTDANFNIFLGALADSAESEMKKLIYAPPDKLDTQQGKTQAVTEIIKSITGAPETLAAHQNKEN